jgi:hypothetical protein
MKKMKSDTSGENKKRGRPFKFNYNDPHFYAVVEDYAAKGLTDKDIAWALVKEFGENISPHNFKKIKLEVDKKGNLTKRAEKLNTALTRGRSKINLLVRAAFLQTALGQRKVKTVTTITRKTENGMEEVQITETEAEVAPNFQAQSTWLFNHDSEWRQKTIDGKKIDITSGGKPMNTDVKVIIVDKREQIEAENEDTYDESLSESQ